MYLFVVRLSSFLYYGYKYVPTYPSILTNCPIALIYSFTFWITIKHLRKSKSTASSFYSLKHSFVTMVESSLHELPYRAISIIQTQRVEIVITTTNHLVLSKISIMCKQQIAWTSPQSPSTSRFNYPEDDKFNSQIIIHCVPQKRSQVDLIKKGPRLASCSSPAHSLVLPHRIS